MKVSKANTWIQTHHQDRYWGP